MRPPTGRLLLLAFWLELLVLALASFSILGSLCFKHSKPTDFVTAIVYGGYADLAWGIGLALVVWAMPRGRVKITLFLAAAYPAVKFLTGILSAFLVGH